MYDTRSERGRPEETALPRHTAPHGGFFRSLSSDRDLINAGSKYTALVTYSPGAGKRRFPIGSFAWV